MQLTFDIDTESETSSLGSSSSSDLSTYSEVEVYQAEFRYQELEPTPRSYRRPRNIYNLHTYLPFSVGERSGSVVDKVYSFSFDRAILPERYDGYFRGIHPLSLSVYNPSRIAHAFRAVNSKVAILRGTYANQSGVIVESYCRLLFHRVLVYDGTVITIRQRDIKLLDPHHILPFGYPLENLSVTNRLA